MLGLCYLVLDSMYIIGKHYLSHFPVRSLVSGHTPVRSHPILDDPVIGLWLHNMSVRLHIPSLAPRSSGNCDTSDFSIFHIIVYNDGCNRVWAQAEHRGESRQPTDTKKMS